jgi:hypothetical protein
VPAARPRHRVRDHLGRGEHLAQVAPDQLLQRAGRDVARRQRSPGTSSRDRSLVGQA